MHSILILQIMRTKLLAILVVCPLLAKAQLDVTITPLNRIGQKAVVELTLTNNIFEMVDSARAVVFLLDGQGKVVGQATRWVIGGAPGKPGLEPKATNSFHFVITSSKLLESTNLTAKVVFTRLVLEGGKSVDPKKNVIVKEGR